MRTNIKTHKYTHTHRVLPSILQNRREHAGSEVRSSQSSQLCSVCLYISKCKIDLFRH